MQKMQNPHCQTMQLKRERSRRYKKQTMQTQCRPSNKPYNYQMRPQPSIQQRTTVKGSSGKCLKGTRGLGSVADVMTSCPATHIW